MADEKPKIKEYDLTIDAERFRFEVDSWVINRTITGMIVRPDRVEVHLDNGRALEFSVRGPDILIHLPVPGSFQPLESETGGRVM